MEKGLTIYNKVFEGCNVDMLVKNDGDILFEIYSVGVAVGYSTKSNKEYFQSGNNFDFPPHGKAKFSRRIKSK